MDIKYLELWFQKLLLELTGPLLFLFCVVFFAIGVSQLSTWIFKRTTVQRLFVSLAFIALGTGFAGTLIRSPVTTSALDQSSHITIATLPAALFFLAAAIIKPAASRKTQFSQTLLLGCCFLAGIYLGTSVFKQKELYLEALNLTVQFVAIQLLRKGIENDKANESNQFNQPPLRDICKTYTFSTATTLISILAWEIWPGENVVGNKTRFCGVLLISMASLIPLIWIHLPEGYSQLKLFGREITKTTQKLVQIIFYILFAVLFCLVAFQAKVRRIDLTKEIAQEAFASQKKIMNSSVLTTIQSSSVFKNALKYHATNSAQTETLQFCNGKEMSCIFLTSMPENIPEKCLKNIEHNKGCSFFSTSNKSDITKNSQKELVLFSRIEVIEDQDHPEKKNFIMVTSGIQSITNSSLIDTHWVLQNEDDVTQKNSDSSLVPAIASNKPCDSNAARIIFLDPKKRNTLTCIPNIDHDSLYNAQGNRVLLFSEHLEGLPATLSLITNAERPRMRSQLYWTGTLIFILGASLLSACKTLIKLKAHAEKLNKLKSSMIADICHEIRNPINGITGVLEILSKGNLTFHQKRLIHNALSAASSLTQIVSDVSGLAKNEVGLLTIEFKAFDLRKTVEQVCTNMSYLAAQKKLDFAVRIDLATPEHLIGDPQKLSQILTNLFSNAIKYTEKGSIALKVICEFVTADRTSLRFEIKDTGVGIPESCIPTLFQRFSRVDNEQMSLIEGSGLGLFITGQLIEKLSGKMGVESTVNEGSLFWFTLDISCNKASCPWIQEIQPILKNRKVLIASERHASREALAASVSQVGAKVTECQNSLQTIQSIADAEKDGDAYDMIYVDEDSFDLAPYTLVKKINELTLHKKPKLIQVAQSFSADHEVQNRENGVIFQLAKPVGPNQLVDCLNHHLSENEQKKLLRNVKSTVVAPNNANLPKGGLRILVAEDNRILQEVAVTQLEILGCSTAIACNGEDAVMAVEKDNFDLVLMDVRMPKMDGFKATQNIRTLETRGRKHIPIVAMTASAMSGDKERCLAAGMDDYISKPINLADLARIIERQTGKNMKPDVR